jgi:hypothetical protein
MGSTKATLKTSIGGMGVGVELITMGTTWSASDRFVYQFSSFMV